MRRLVNCILIPLLTFLFLSAMAEIALRIAFARSLDFSMEMWKYAVALKRPGADDNLAFVHAPSSRADRGVPTLELIDGLRNHGPESSLWITPLDDHPNAKANGLVAAQIKRWILDDIRQSHADAAFTVAKR